MAWFKRLRGAVARGRLGERARQAFTKARKGLTEIVSRRVNPGPRIFVDYQGLFIPDNAGLRETRRWLRRNVKAASSKPDSRDNRYYRSVLQSVLLARAHSQVEVEAARMAVARGVKVKRSDFDRQVREEREKVYARVARAGHAKINNFRDAVRLSSIGHDFKSFPVPGRKTVKGRSVYDISVYEKMIDEIISYGNEFDRLKKKLKELLVAE